MDYRKLVETIPVPKREPLSDRLIDFILSSKNDDKMPSQLANNILHRWQNDILISESGLTALLEAAVLLELDKTIGAFTELGLTGLAEQIKQAAPKT
jgi:predicted alpha/beta hydrolase family esterase